MEHATYPYRGLRSKRHSNEKLLSPDPTRIDLDQEHALVNWLILENLASRADVGADPLIGMAPMYDVIRQIVPDVRSAIELDQARQPSIV